MELMNSIISKNKEEIKRKLLTIEDINFPINGFTFLWVAIQGSMARPLIKNESYAEYEIIQILLDKGADANKKSVYMTPLYLATYHNRSDIVRLLLMNGANRNEPSLVKCEKGKIIYEMQLNIAIRNTHEEIVEILILYKALYNKITQQKIMERLYNIKKKSKIWEEVLQLRKLMKIQKILKINYLEDMENGIVDYMNKAKKIGTFHNYFSCFQNKN